MPKRWNLLRAEPILVFCAGLLSAPLAMGQPCAPLLEAHAAFDLAGTFFPPPTSVEYAIWEDGTPTILGFRDDGSGRGLYKLVPTGLEPILVEGQEAPGLPGRTLVTGPSGEWVSRLNGSFLQAFTTDGAGDDRTAAFLCDPLCEVVFLEGDPFPGLVDVEFDFGVIAPRVGPLGQIAFYATLSGAGAPVGTARALVAGPPSALELLAREGDPAVGLPAEAFTGDMFNDVRLAFNAQSGVAFLASTQGGESAWSGVPASVQVQAIDGGPSPEPGVPLDRLNSLALERAESFTLWTGAGGQRLYGNLGAVGRVTAAAGDVSASGDQIGGIGAPSVSPSGRVSFVSDAFGERILFLERSAPSGIYAIAKTSEQAPGLATGVVFEQLPFQPILNAHGQVAFVADLSGPGIDPQANRSWWIYDPACGPQLIAQEGAALSFPVGPPRVLQSLDELSGLAGWNSANSSLSNQDGANLHFNDRGQLVFLAGFTDGSWAVVVSQVAPWFFADGFEAGDTSSWSATSR